jgi:hypothetical protein
VPEDEDDECRLAAIERANESDKRMDSFREVTILLMMVEDGWHATKREREQLLRNLGTAFVV